MQRPYFEQSRIPNFEALDYKQRRMQVESLRHVELLRLQRIKNPKLYKQTRKNYRETASYIHLGYNERQTLVKELARCVSKWGFARLFAECIDKVHFVSARTMRSIDEQAFEQVISRFEQYLQNTSRNTPSPSYGLLIHDNNETVAKKHTALMKNFHQQGTFWTTIKSIIETPLFVDSQLTSMVQIADLCGYALRRYLENGEDELFDLLFERADRKDGVVVGVRHFTKPSGCTCKICNAHKRS